MTEPVAFTVWKLMPEEEKLLRLREDNDRMDSAMMSRHLARFLHAASPEEPGDPGAQIALLSDERFVSNHGSILKQLGGLQEGEGLKRFYDQVTILALRMASSKEPEKKQILDAIRAAIALAAGIAPVTPEKKEEN